MSAKYGITIQLSGPKEDEGKCLADLTASLREHYRDKDREPKCYEFLVIPGSYCAKVRTDDGVVISYMMTTPSFWSRSHDEAIIQLAALYPTLTLFMYGDSFEAGDGFRVLYVAGKAIVDDVFHLDHSDRPTDVRRRVYGDGIDADNLVQHIPDKYAENFPWEDYDSDLPQTWDEVRAEVGAPVPTSRETAVQGWAAVTWEEPTDWSNLPWPDAKDSQATRARAEIEDNDLAAQATEQLLNWLDSQPDVPGEQK